MRRLILVVLLMLVPAWLSAQATTQARDVAHGGEKAGHEVAHPGEEHGGQHEEPKFLGLPAWIFKFVNMVLFLGVLVYFLRGPVKNALTARHEQVRREAEEARERRAKADRLAADIQARLSQIENDVRAIHARAEAEGERQKRELIAAAEAEGQRILQSARHEVDNRLKHAREELTAYAGQLAADRAEQILREKITDQDKHKLFDESVREVAKV
jgi:F-type H+-transporting ATPase subunit b